MRARRGGVGRLLGVAMVVVAAVGCSDSGAEDGWAPMPSSPVTGAPTGGGEQPMQALRALLTAREEFIRDCMAAEGFAYVPRLAQLSDTVVETVGIGLYGPMLYDVDEAVAWAREWGLGLLVEDPLAMEQAMMGDQPVAVDPNDEIRRALPSADQQAYVRALYGDNESVTEDGGGAEDGGGCYTAAERAHPDPPVSVEVAARGDALHEEFDRRFEADARIGDADAAHHDCLRAAGYPQGAIDHVKQRFRAVAGLAWDEVGFDAVNLLDPADFRRLQAEERQAAEAEARCRGPLYEVWDEVGTELEQAIIEEFPEAVEIMGGNS